MQLTNKFDVTGLGSLAVDFIGSIEHWPELGTKNFLLNIILKNSNQLLILHETKL